MEQDGLCLRIILDQGSADRWPSPRQPRLHSHKRRSLCPGQLFRCGQVKSGKGQNKFHHMAGVVRWPHARTFPPLTNKLAEWRYWEVSAATIPGAPTPVAQRVLAVKKLLQALHGSCRSS